MTDRDIKKKPEARDNSVESPKSSTELNSETTAIDTSSAPLSRRSSIASALLNMGINSNAATTIGPSPGNIISALFGRRSQANSAIGPPLIVAEDQQPTSHNQSVNTAQATGGSEPIQQEQSSRLKQCTLSNDEAVLVLTAAGVGGMGPMISADGNISSFGPQENMKHNKEEDKKTQHRHRR
ncbi:hypothetical protein BZA77DRAFT_296426 [Pyronema omphalodes]|nr:hypothetical protein BZA77DRAFT_296426 [Pyronema omphalodes]